LSNYPKTCNFTICSIFSNSGHVGWYTASPDTILKLKTLVMIQTKFGFNWSSSFRGEDFWKSLRRTTDDRRQVMAIAHLALWTRWAMTIRSKYIKINITLIWTDMRESDKLTYRNSSHFYRMFHMIHFEDLKHNTFSDRYYIYEK
jgi:hypothetical protein